MPDVWRPEEALRIGIHQHLLRAIGRRQPDAQTIVVVMIGSVSELPATHEPGRFAVTELLGHAGQRETELSQSRDLVWVGRPLRGCDATTVMGGNLGTHQ
jgi:hypothetical protein